MNHFPKIKIIVWATILMGLVLTLPVFADLPDLPENWRANLKPSQQYILVDFYSQTCGTCQKLEPYLQKLQRELGNKVKFQRADIYSPTQKSLGKLFYVTGTPTYILFRKDGQAIYRIQHSLSIEVLSSQIKRLIGITPAQPSFGTLPEAETLQKQNPFVLLAVHPENCEHCQTMTPYLKAIGQAKDLARMATKVGVMTVDPAKPEVTPWLKANRYKPIEAYALYDNHAKLLFYSPYPLTPQELWKRLKLYTEMGLN